jgi:ketosteroid isomerase-like protein
VEAAVFHSESLALVRRVIGSINAHDVDGFLAALDPDIEASPSIAGGSVLHGRDAVRKWWTELAELGDEVEIRPLDFEQCGDCVLVRGYLRHSEGHVLAENQVFWVCEIHHGQIVRMESHPTRDAALAAC